MTPLEKQIKEKQYQDYVKQHTPVHNVWTNMLKAFLTGGSICNPRTADFKLNCKTLGLSEKDCGAWTAIVLVLFSVILTGLNVYSKIANWGGAGALVPITGFANSVAAPAIEYKKEGQVFGIGAKIFTIAGPVLLYGVVTSWALGVVYWVAFYLVH